MSMVTGHGPLSSDPAGWFSPPAARAGGLRRAASPPDPRDQGRPGGDRHRARVTGAPTGSPAQLCVSRRPGARSARRTRCRGTGIRAGALGRGGHLDRGGTHAGALSAQPVSPRRLPAHHAAAAGRRGRHHAGRHRRHRDRVRDRLGSATLRSPGARAQRSSAAIGYLDILQLQGLRNLLVGSRRRYRNSDVAWCYLDPPPESRPLAGFFSFDAGRATVLAELPVHDLGGA